MPGPYFEDPDDQLIDARVDQRDRCRSAFQMRVELKEVEDVKDRAGEAGVHRGKVQLPDRVHLIGEHGCDR